MKALTISFLIMFTAAANAVCLVPISRDNINPGQVPTSVAYNSDFDNLYARANTVPGNCLLDLSLREKQIEDGAIGTTHFANASVTTPKLANGALPTFGKLIRIRHLTASGSWTKSNDVGFVVIHVVGGGGGYSSNGGNSSFGAHCTANGGASGASGGAGGTASSGDINLTGGSGMRGTSTGYFISTGISGYTSFGGYGGHSRLNPFGQGGSYYHRLLNDGGSTRWGGGSGGYCMKVIQAINLNSPEVVTVGSGGTGPTNSNPGKNGIVLIYEYGR